MDGHNEYIFCEYKIKSWEGCRALLADLKDWVFRGQSNSQWSLQTTLERSAITSDCDIRKIPKIETKIIEKFQRCAFQYVEKAPDINEKFEWLSLLQHHGGPTRLLDFTYSYYVALFFSTENALQESAVYCLNKNLIHSKGLETEKERGLLDVEKFGRREYCNNVLNEQVLSPLVMLVEPYNMHERLSRQQGLFAVPFEGQQGFEYNLSLTFSKYQKSLPESKKLLGYRNILDLLNKECALLKLVIPKRYHNRIRQELRLMNITSETLFPGIDGFARSLNSVFEE